MLKDVVGSISYSFNSHLSIKNKSAVIGAFRWWKI